MTGAERDVFERPQLLAGVRVIDLSQFVPGPFATLMLSDLGAEVVKVEPPQGDPQRQDGPLDEDGLSAWYKLVNRNKSIVQLDLKSDAGRSDFEELLRCADVLLESFRPGVLERLGYGRAKIERINPSLIHCALSGWGQTGPYRLKAGHDINYQALAGVLDSTGTKAAPAVTTPAIADYAGALNSVALICAALFARQQTRRGSYIDIGMADAALSLMGTELTAMTRPGFDPRRGRGPYSGGWACYNIYRTADGKHITIGALEPKFWTTFCDLVGRPGWASRQNEPLPQYGLIADVAELIGSRNLASWRNLLDAHDTCFQPVMGLEEIANDSQVGARKILQASNSGTIDTLMPAWVDGHPPPRRADFRVTSADIVISNWKQKADTQAP